MTSISSVSEMFPNSSLMSRTEALWLSSFKSNEDWTSLVAADGVIGD
jgi:hypothetical protein